MLYIDIDSTDPAWNLALEEHLFFGKKEEVFMLWQNAGSIIIGKNQNAMAEIDYDYVTANHIPVVRRLSGGGAVYHDLGNLNFTYIVNREGFGDYVGFTMDLCNYLKQLGLNAAISGRNDVLCDGRKISGNAQYAKNGRLLHHGTILISADMTHLSKALRPDEEKIRSKGIRSVKSRVLNLGEILNMSATEFRSGFSAYIQKNTDVTPYELTKEDLAAADKLKREKYDTFSWNFGYSPKYAFHTKKHFPNGTLEVFLDIKDGLIEDVCLFGDFLEDADAVSAKLIGKPHRMDAVKEVLGSSFSGLCDADSLLKCFF